MANLVDASRRPGRPRHMTPNQERVLTHLREHPWAKVWPMSKALDLPSSAIHGALNALEAKGLVEAASIGRIKHWAPAGARRPPGAMPLQRGAPSLFHATNVPGRVQSLLAREPWLPASVIARKLGSAFAAKTVTERVREMGLAGRLARRVIDTPIRRMSVYALPGAPAPRGAQIARARRLVGETTPFWTTKEAILAYLKANGWSTKEKVAAGAHVRPGYVWTALYTLERKGLVKRARVRWPTTQGFGRTTRLCFALPSTPLPREMLAVPDANPREHRLARVAAIVRELGRAVRASEVGTVYRERYGHGGDGYMLTLLKRLAELGVVVREKRGRNAGLYVPNGAADAHTTAAADAYLAALRADAARLVDLGYVVTLHVVPPASRAHAPPAAPHAFPFPTTNDARHNT